MRTIINNPLVTVHEGDALMTLRTLEADSVDCCVTSPPYWGLRDYGHADQIGVEASPFEYIEKMVGVFDEVRRVLKPSGTCWVVIGDSYAASPAGNRIFSDKQQSNHGSIVKPSRHFGGSIKPKDLVGIPWRLAFALQDQGWYLRQDIIWAKPNPMPESVTDRCTRSHEYVFLLTKRARYYYDAEAISTPIQDDSLARLKRGWKDADVNRGWPDGRLHHLDKYIRDEKSRENLTVNRRDVWTIQNEYYPEAHFATFPTALVEMCIKAGCPADGLVLDPFAGCGTTGEVAIKLGCKAVLIELNPQYVEMIRRNLGLFALAKEAT